MSQAQREMGPLVHAIDGMRKRAEDAEKALRNREAQLLSVIAEKDKEIARLQEVRETLLEQRPASLKDDWKLPEAPKCQSCGIPVVAVAYNDCGEISFHWDEWCEECEGETGASTDGVEFDDWPFDVETVWTNDLERAGFRVE